MAAKRKTPTLEEQLQKPLDQRAARGMPATKDQLAKLKRSIEPEVGPSPSRERGEEPPEVYGAEGAARAES
jgi:hypothetical protein